MKIRSSKEKYFVMACTLIKSQFLYTLSVSKLRVFVIVDSATELVLLYT